MTPNESPLLPGPWPDALAAYADGELDPAARAVVECWLAKHPEMLCSLHAQRHLSPDNWSLWRQVEPPLPAEAAWNAVREAVHRGIESPPMPAAPRRRNWWVRNGSYFAGGIAAAIALVLLASWFYPNGPEKIETVSTALDDPLAEYEVLPLATDVDIERAVGNSHDFLLGHEPLALAGEDDIQLEEAEPHPAWPGGSPKMTTAPGDVPMIFAARLR